MKDDFQLCGCITGGPEELQRSLMAPDVQMLELRLDCIADGADQRAVARAVGMLAQPRRHPVIATNRPPRQGGKFQGTDSLRLEILKGAAAVGAEWVDLEADLPAASIEWFRAYGLKILLSWHDFDGTPPREQLQEQLEAMAARRPDAVKIVTRANAPDDNLRVLELIALGRKSYELPAIAFCMGEMGRFSRPLSLLLGSPWTYVRMAGQPQAAPGQLSAREIHEILERLA